MGPNALRWAERVLAILRAGGVPDDLAVVGQRLLIATVNGFTLDETGPREPADGTPMPSQGAAVATARNYLESLPPSRFPNLVALAAELAAEDRDQEFEVLIDLYVNGLAELTRKPPKRTSRAPSKRRG
jgi:hypothetical protein